jgi:hypothetical protein
VSSLAHIKQQLAPLAQKLEIAYQSASKIQDGAELFLNIYGLIKQYLEAIQERFAGLPKNAHAANEICHGLTGKIENTRSQLWTSIDREQTSDVKQKPEKLEKLEEFTQLKAKATFIWWG